MPSIRRLAILVYANAVLAATAPAAQTIPVRQLTPAVGTDSGMVRGIFAVRPLSNGSVVLNDATRHRVFVFDSTMKRFVIALDSAPDAANSYGGNSGNIIRYRGDTTLYLDYDAKALIVIDPSGRIGRTMAMVRASDALGMLGALANQGYDPRGRFIMRVPRSRPRATTPAAQTDSTTTVTLRRDSAAIIRIDPETRAVDTIAILGTPVSKTITVTTATGYSSGGAQNPLPMPDDWTLLPDGTVAVVRAHDYHIDWYSPDGVATSSPRMAFAWKPITLEEKQQLIDSLRKVAEARAALGPQTTSLGGITRPIPRTPPVYFEPAELPDFYPPIRAGQVKADPEGNVWVLPTTSIVPGAGLTYDLVNRKGEVFERVKLPEGRNLVAVGARGVVYMSYTPRGGLVRLERATIIR
jgi:hypothetical protein